MSLEQSVGQKPAYVPFAATAQLFLRIFCSSLAILICVLSSVLNANTLQQQMTEAVAENELAGLPATVVMLNGERVADASFAGEDERWGGSDRCGSAWPRDAP